MENILQTRVLTKVYGKNKSLDQVSIHIQKGDIYGLIGKNGAGKTTFMKTCLDIAIKTSGEVEFFDQSGRKGKESVGVLIENPSLMKNMSAEKNLEYFSILFGGTKNEIKDILQKVGLDHTGKKKVKDFSLGMRQRLGIAIALLGNPEFVILDEPINGLDPEGIKEIRDLIVGLNQEQGVTFLISSHLLDELGKIATKYGILDHGTLIEEITREELDQRCSKKLIIKTDDNEKAVMIINENFGNILQAKTVDDEIHVTGDLSKGGNINTCLVQNNVTVSMLYHQMQSLEEYFIKRV